MDNLWFHHDSVIYWILSLSLLPLSLTHLLPSFLPLLDALCHTSYQMSRIGNIRMTDIIPIWVMGDPRIHIWWMDECIECFGSQGGTSEKEARRIVRKGYVFVHIPSHASFLHIVAYLSSYKTRLLGHNFFYQPQRFMIYT